MSIFIKTVNVLKGVFQRNQIWRIYFGTCYILLIVGDIAKILLQSMQGILFFDVQPRHSWLIWRFCKWSMQREKSRDYSYKIECQKLVHQERILISRGKRRDWKIDQQLLFIWHGESFTLEKESFCWGKTLPDYGCRSVFFDSSCWCLKRKGYRRGSMIGKHSPSFTKTKV